MSDLFNEQLVKRKGTASDNLKKGGIIAGGIVVALIPFVISQLFIFILPILVVDVLVCMLLFKRFDIEYEYSLTNSDLDIDVIYSKSRRKHLLTLDVKDIEMMVALKNYPNDINNTQKELDYSSGELKDSTFGIQCKINDKNTKLIIEPNEKIVKGIKMYIPSRVKL